MGQWSYLYAKPAWRKARAHYLKNNPLCVMCERLGRTRAATVVDHVRPHKGNMVLFWDFRNNVQPLCKQHHDSTKQSHEANPNMGCDEAGNPRSPNKAW